MNSSQKIFNKVSGLWGILQDPLKEFLRSNLGLMLQQKEIWIFVQRQKILYKGPRNPDALAKACLTLTMKQQFKSVETCEDVYALLSIIMALYTKNVSAVARKVREQRNKWAHSNCGSAYWNSDILEAAFQEARKLIEVLQSEDRKEILLKIEKAEAQEYFSQEEVKIFKE